MPTRIVTVDGESISVSSEPSEVARRLEIALRAGRFCEFLIKRDPLAQQQDQRSRWLNPNAVSYLQRISTGDNEPGQPAARGGSTP